jgi:hypothetical protein
MIFKYDIKLHEVIMVKQIVRDQIFLQQKSEPATEADAKVIVDLITY